MGLTEPKTLHFLLNSSMPAYFQTFTSCEPGELSLPATDRPTQRNPDILPFDALSGRRFEILCYRLKKAQHPHTIVHLMQGTGDTGRDVVVFKDGRVAEVVQCKNQRERLTKPQLLTELGKLALYHYLEPRMLGPVSYEMWCPPGLSGPASDLINTWPSRWVETEIAGAVKRLLKLPTFADLTWNNVKSSILHDFPKLLSPRKLEGIDLTDRVRQSPEIFDGFFVVHRVISETDVRRVLSEAGWRQLNDADIKHLVDRVESFSSHERLRFLSNYVLGLKPEFILAMTKEELEVFYKNIMQSVIGNLETIMKVGIRKAFSLLSVHVALMPDHHPAFLYAMMRLVKIWAATRCNPFPNSLSKKHSEYNNAPIEEQYRSLLEYIWEHDVIQGDPALHSDHNVPLAIIRKQFASRQAFEQRLQEAFVSNRKFIDSVFRDLDVFMPKQFVVISDTMSVLDGDGSDRTLVESFKRTMQALGSTPSGRNEEPSK